MFHITISISKDSYIYTVINKYIKEMQLSSIVFEDYFSINHIYLYIQKSI